MPRRRTSRIYWRKQGGLPRAYGDFRDYADVGGGQEALRPKGAKLATDAPDIAEQLAAERVRELEQRRRNKSLLGIERPATLAAFAREHLRAMAKGENVTDAWLEQAQRHLDAAVEFFKPARELGTISVREVRAYSDWLGSRSNGRGIRCTGCGSTGNVAGLRATCECGREWSVPALSGGTRRQYLNSLSKLYRRAAGEGVVLPGYNPVSALMEKPKADEHEARWMEVHDAALLLEAARTHAPAHDDETAIPAKMLHAILATLLLTGGRWSEVRGLAVEDVSFDRRRMTFRPHPWRRLKTRVSHRSVPLWPQLEEVLREYLWSGDTPRVDGLLFPSLRNSNDGGMIQDIRKTLDALAARCGWQAGEIRTKMFRHTYCAARLQTTDRGAPVALYTVAKEMGHGGDRMVRRVYAHLGEHRHRAEVVEYRAEQHTDALGERLAAVQALRGRQTA